MSSQKSGVCKLPPRTVKPPHPFEPSSAAIMIMCNGRPLSAGEKMLLERAIAREEAEAATAAVSKLNV